VPAPLDRTSPLVDPDHALGSLRGSLRGSFRGRRQSARSAPQVWRAPQVCGQRGQFTNRAGGQGSFQPLLELLGGQPTVAHGGAQHLDDPVPVRVRSPQLWKVRGHSLPLSLRVSRLGEPTLYPLPGPAKVEPAPSGSVRQVRPSRPDRYAGCDPGARPTVRIKGA
jgi:hypothetical protein